MTSPSLTENGIQKLVALTGKFHETNIIVNFYFPPPSLGEEEGEEESPAKEELAIVSDGIQCLHVLNETNSWSEDDYWNDHYCVVRIRKAMFCSYGDGTLLLSHEFMDFLSSGRLESNSCLETFFNLEDIRNVETDIPIDTLRYFSNHFKTRLPTIRGLVTFKSRLEDPYFDYTNLEIFAIHIEDESSEVRLYARGDVARELYGRFEEGHIYRIENLSRIRKPFQDLFHNLTSSELYELSHATYIEECLQDKKRPLKPSFNFLPIPRITKLGRKDKHHHHHIDVVGIVHSVGPLESRINWYNKSQIPKRTIAIVDQSGTILPVILWTYRAIEFDINPLTIVALRHVRIQEDTAHGVSVLSTSTIHVEPDGVEEVYALRQWYDQVGRYLLHNLNSMDSKMMCDSDTSMVVD